MEIPITQSEHWQKLQKDLGEISFLKQEKAFQYLAIVKNTPVGNYLYCPYGPVATDEQAFDEAIKSLQSLSHQHNAIFLRIEPQNPNLIGRIPKGLVKSYDLNPRETWVLDLTGSDEELKQKLPSRLLRYYKAAERKGITIETSHNPEDIHYLLDLQRVLAREKGINTFSEKYLKTELEQPFATLYLVRYQNPESEPEQKQNSELDSIPMPSNNKDSSPKAENRIIAAGLVFDDGTTRYNLQGAQSDEGRKLHATGILTIQLILDAKAKALQIFDFWGIAPEGAPADHPWAGFTGFKKTFAGYERDYAGTYDLVINPVKYKLYQASRRVNRLIRKKS